MAQDNIQIACKMQGYATEMAGMWWRSWLTNDQILTFVRKGTGLFGDIIMFLVKELITKNTEVVCNTHNLSSFFLTCWVHVLVHLKK